MIVLISRAPPGQTLPAEVGTQDCIIVRHYKTIRGALAFATKYAEGRRSYRAEFFRDGRFYSAPYLTITKHLAAPPARDTLEL